MGSLNRKGGNGGNGKSNTKRVVEYSNLEHGQEYEGRLVYVADLGLQERNYMGDVKPSCQQLSLGIEIIGETITIDEEKMPRILWSKPFNIFSSLTEKGKEIEYAKTFNPAKAIVGEVFDWEDVLGTPCSVVVQHSDSKDKTVIYDNIGILSPIPKKYQKDVGEALTTPCVGDSDDENNECTKALFGLARWKWENRVSEGDEVEEEVDY